MLNTKELRASYESDPIIAGLNHEQLTCFYTDEEKEWVVSEIIKINHASYSSESKDLDAILSGSDPIQDKWVALILYCTNPLNNRKGLRTAIESVLLDKSLNLRSKKAYKDAVALINENNDKRHNCDKAIMLLRSIPTTETRKDSEVTPQQLYEILSQAFEEKGDYSQAARSYELAYPTERLYDSFHHSNFKRRLTLFGKSIEDGQFLTEFSRAPCSVSERNRTLFFNTTVDCIKMGSYPGIGILYIAGQGHTLGVIAFGLFGLGVLVVGVVAGAIIGCVAGAIQRVVELKTRVPQDTDSRQKFVEDFSTFSRTANDKVKQKLIQGVVKQYQDTKTVASSKDSEKTLEILEDSEIAFAEKLLSLLFYISVSNNNGKRLYQIIQNQFQENQNSENCVPYGKLF